jgi:hypothetical protein
MSRLIAAFLVLSAFTACNNPFVEGCACTAKACFQGVVVDLEEKPDPNRYKDFSMTLAYGDTLEAASEFWSFNDSARFYFSSPRLLRQKPKQVVMRISYTEQDAEKSASLDTAIAWSSFVCNSCSGGSPSCKDDRNYMASVKIGSARLLE